MCGKLSPETQRKAPAACVLNKRLDVHSSCGLRLTIADFHSIFILMNVEKKVWFNELCVGPFCVDRE